MKTILLILLATVGYSQNTTIHFYGSSKKTLGSEVLFLLKNVDYTYLGGGFSGATQQKSVLSSHINDYDNKQNKTSFNEEWCSIYATGSIGFISTIMVKFKGGLAVYNKKVDFINDNGYEYTKIDRVIYSPMIGISGMYSITQDIGIEVGFDTFNKGTIGLTVLF